MSARLSGTKRRWVAAMVGAAAVMALLLLLFRVPASKPVSAGSASATKRTVTLKSGRKDELALRDLAPLFLPTAYNAAAEEPKLAPTRNVLDTDSPKWKFDENNPHLQMPSAFPAVTTPLDALTESPRPLAAGIGRTDANVVPARAHDAYVEIFAAASGDVVMRETLGPGARLPLPGRDGSGWRPLEFMAAIDATGLIGQPVLTTGSGSEEVDVHFRNYLARTFRIGDRLTPGFYRIVVGP